MKTNLFSFSAPLDAARYLQRKLTELTGKKVACNELNHKLSETEEITLGEIRISVPTKLLSSVTDLLKTMESGEHESRDLFGEYKKNQYFRLPIIHHRSVVCPPPCQYGYIMVRGNACQCYTCKGNGYFYPQVGFYELQKIDKRDAFLLVDN